MSGELICPDCGGVIGATEPTEAGQPCTCFASEPSDVKSSTMVIQSPVSQKICCVCGVDVSGKKRAKDDRGYWCYECHLKDKEQKKAERRARKAAEKGVRPGQIPDAKKNGTPQSTCPECGRLVPIPSLEMWDGIQLCGKCYRGHKEAAMLVKKKRTISSIERKAERQRMLVLIVVLLVLVLIAVLGHYHILPSPV